MRIEFEKKIKNFHYATLRKDGEDFIIVVNPNEAIDYKKGKITNVSETLEIEEIYSDVKKGEVAADLKKHFGTDNKLEIASEILKKGILQITNEYKKKMQEQKKKEIINIIATNGVDPRNNLPIPLTRIELALEQVSFNFDPFKSAQEQVEPLVEKLRPILPIRFEEKTIHGTVPQQFSSKANGIVSKYGKIIKSEWKNDGSWSFVITIPGGLRDEFINTLNNITHGNVILDLR